LPNNVQVPTETNIQQVINYAVSTTIPALISAVDKRVGSISGTSVSTMRATVNKIKVTTQKRARDRRRFGDKQSFVLDRYKGDTAASGVSKSTKIYKQHVCCYSVMSWKLLTFFFVTGDRSV
jgi:hypothetical protein